MFDSHAPFLTSVPFAPLIAFLEPRDDCVLRFLIFSCLLSPVDQFSIVSSESYACDIYI